MLPVKWLNTLFDFSAQIEHTPHNIEESNAPSSSGLIQAHAATLTEISSQAHFHIEIEWTVPGLAFGLFLD